MTFTTVPFQTNMRAAGVTLLNAYAASAGLNLQVYPARPRSIFPPSAFVDGISETLVLTGPLMRQRTPLLTMVVLHGLFDSKDSVQQRDRFVDGFLDWILDNYHAAGSTTGFGDRIQIEDDPAFTPNWPPFSSLPPGEVPTYYATYIRVEGYAEA